MGIENYLASFLLSLPILAFLVFEKYTGTRQIGSLLYLRDIKTRQWFINLHFIIRKDRWIYFIIILILALLGMGPQRLSFSNITMLIMDNSVSMSSKLDHGTRLDKAREILKELGNREFDSGNHVVMMPLIASPDSPDLLPISDREVFHKALSEIKAQTVPANAVLYMPTIFTTASTLRVKRIVFATDQALTESFSDHFTWLNVLEGKDGSNQTNVGFIRVNQPAALFEPPWQSEIVVRNLTSRPARNISLKYRFSESSPAHDAVQEPFTLQPYGERRFKRNELSVKDDDRSSHGDEISRPYLLSLDLEGDIFDLDNHLWVLPEVRQRFSVSMPCQNEPGALWKRILPHPNIILDFDDQNEKRPRDLVIFDSCADTPNFDNPPTHSIFISHGDPSDTTVEKVKWQGNRISVPLLNGIKPLFNMLLHRPKAVRLPATSKELFPLFGQYLMQVSKQKDENTSEPFETTFYGQSRNGKHFLYLGFDVNYFCDSTIQGGGAFRNDDCLSMVLLAMNALQMMLPYTKDQLYFQTGHIYHGDKEKNQRVGLIKEVLLDDTCGDTSAEIPLEPFAPNKWMLQQPGLYRICGDKSRPPLYISVSLLNADVSQLDKPPVTIPSSWRNSIQPSIQVSVVHLLVMILIVVMGVESVIVIHRMRKT